MLLCVAGLATPDHPLPPGLHPDCCLLQGRVVRTHTDTHWVGRQRHCSLLLLTAIFAARIANQLPSSVPVGNCFDLAEIVF